MPGEHEVSLVIPTYNEAAGIEKLIDSLARVFVASGIDGEIIIVDDNSPDGTGRLVDSLAQRYPVRCVHRSGKLGLSSAVLAGWAASQSEIVGVMDADLSHDPKILPQLVRAVRDGACELAIGSRYVPGGGIANWPWRRRVTSLVAIWLARPLTKVKDITSGYFFCRRSVIDNVELDPIGFKIGLEVLAKGKYKSVQEVPYVFTDRTQGSSKLNSGEIVNYLRQLGKLYFAKRSHRSRNDGNA